MPPIHEIALILTGVFAALGFGLIIVVAVKSLWNWAFPKSDPPANNTPMTDEEWWRLGEAPPGYQSSDFGLEESPTEQS